MALLNPVDNVVNLREIHAWAGKRVEQRIQAQLFDRVPLLAFMAGKMTGDSNFGRPGRSWPDWRCRYFFTRADFTAA